MSILKPLKGLEEDLEQNARSFFELNYPRFELIFCVAEKTDAAVGVINRLMDEYPAIDARILFGEDLHGVNPKIRNLQKAYDSALFDVVLISDSNVQVSPDYLSKLVPLLEGSNVGLVTAPVISSFGSSWVRSLEAFSLSTFYARGMVMASACGFPMVMGKSMLFRRSVFSRFGGLRSLGNYLAEDYMAGYAVQQLGLNVVLNTEALYQSVSHQNMADFWKRHLRWGRMRKVTNPLAFLIEPLGNALPLSLLGAAGFSGLFHFPFFSIFGLLLTGFFLQDMILTARLHKTIPWNFAILWLIRETLTPLLWFHTLWGRSVSWKGQDLKLQAGGLVSK